jgi:hypothetical protein
MTGNSDVTSQRKALLMHMALRRNLRGILPFSKTRIPWTHSKRA